MRVALIACSLMTLAACGETNRPAPPATEASSGLPSGFPQADLTAQAGECIVYLSLSLQANATPEGYDAPIMQQASDQWRASLEVDAELSEEEIAQLVGSSVNALTTTPEAQRDAASAWCVANAAEPDPAN
jgi:hypothetical protein